MIKIENHRVVPNQNLPDWWIGGQDVRVIIKPDNAFFIYKCDMKSAPHTTLPEDKVLEIPEAQNGWYDVLNHSKVCVCLIYSRPLDISPEEDMEIKDIDPRVATPYDMNLWFFLQAKKALKDKSIPRGFADAIRVMENAYMNMKLERKGLTQRKMETREIVVDDDDED